MLACSCSQNFCNSSLLAISFKCARLLEISLILLCSFFHICKRKISYDMIKTKSLKHPYLWFQSVFNSSACNCCGGAVCLIGKTHEDPRQLFRVLVYSLSYFIVAGFLLEIRTVLLFRYMNFHIFTSFFTTDLWLYYELTT